MRWYITKPAESIVGIALRELGDESRWQEIRDLNVEEYPAMLGPDYYPVGTAIVLPEREVK